MDIDHLMLKYEFALEELITQLKIAIKEELELINDKLLYHDVRMVPGITHTNLIFDVVKPFDLKISDDELKSKIAESIKKRFPDVNCVITVDSPYVSYNAC